MPESASAGARRGHFNTKGTKITKGTKKSCGAFAAETAGDQPRDLKTSFALFALFVPFVSKCPRPTPGLRASPQNQGAYPDQIDPQEDVLDRRPIAVRQHFDGMKVDCSKPN